MMKGEFKYECLLDKRTNDVFEKWCEGIRKTHGQEKLTNLAMKVVEFFNVVPDGCYIKEITYISDHRLAASVHEDAPCTKTYENVHCLVVDEIIGYQIGYSVLDASNGEMTWKKDRLAHAFKLRREKKAESRGGISISDKLVEKVGE
jgi:hypothetical protein